VGLLLKVLVNAAAVWVAVVLVPGLELEEGRWLALLGIGLIVGVVNIVVKPVLTVLSLPLIVLTLGLFLLVVNAIALWVAIAISGALGLGLTATGFGSIFLGAIVVSLVSWGLETLTGVR
jgi:putative membrane protein